MSHVIKKHIFANDMSGIKEYITLISFNCRKLRYLNNQTRDYIADKTGLDIQLINHLETEKRCSLSTALIVAGHFKVTMNDLLTPIDFDTKRVLPLRKLDFVKTSMIPAELHDSIFNFIAKEEEYIDRVSFRTWLDFISFRGRVQRTRNENVPFMRRIINLDINETTSYMRKNHIHVLDYILINNITNLKLRKNKEHYTCTRIL